MACIAQGFNILGLVNRTAYGYHTLNIAKAAVDMHVDVSLWPLGDVEYLQEFQEVLSTVMSRQETCDYTLPSVNLLPISMSCLHTGSGLRIALAAFPTTKFHRHYTGQLLNQDLLIVPSKWAQSVIEQELPGVPCAVVPEGVDQTVFHPNIEPFADLFGRATKFISIGKWENRKGQHELVRAFNKAFEPNDKVALILVCQNYLNDQINHYWQNLCKTCKLSDKILVCNDRFQFQEEIAKLMACADCGVFPSRAQAWSSEVLEMMGMGKPVIVTNYSGHTEHCNHSNSLLIEIDELEYANDGIWFHGDGQWAKLGNTQEEQMITHMRQIHYLKQTGADLFNYDGVETIRSLTWRNTLEKLMNAMTCLSRTRQS